MFSGQPAVSSFNDDARIIINIELFFVCQARISERLFLRSQKIFFVKLFVHIIMDLQDGIIAEDGVGVSVFSVPLSSEASLPLIEMCPASGRISPRIAWMIVLFPAPFFPAMPVTVPSGTSMEI